MGNDERAKAYMELSMERPQELPRQDALGTGIRLNLEDILCLTCILAYGILSGLACKCASSSAVGIGAAAVLDRKAGYFECPHCNTLFVPTMNDYIKSYHTFTKRRLTCPTCGKPACAGIELFGNCITQRHLVMLLANDSAVTIPWLRCFYFN